jgi:hypothetical protein
MPRDFLDLQGTLYEAEKQFCLGLYRYAVAKYQPMIEERARVRLGPISVKDITELHIDTLRAMELQARRAPWGFLRWPLFCLRRRALAESLRERLGQRPDKACACYFWNAIYVSFQNGTRVHEEYVARAAVHELAHALWERLGGRFHSRVQRVDQVLKLFVEGFATYAETVWFVDFYPTWLRTLTVQQAKRIGPDADPHAQGFKVVERLVEEDGTGVLLHLPREWGKHAVPALQRLAQSGLPEFLWVNQTSLRRIVRAFLEY